MKPVPKEESAFKQKCKELVSAADAKCEYAEWNEARKGLLKICKAHGTPFNVLDGTGDFIVLEDWFNICELCVKEARAGFLNARVLDEVARYLCSLPRGYFVLPSPDNIFASLRYSIVLHGKETWVTVADGRSAKNVEDALAGTNWFSASVSS